MLFLLAMPLIALTAFVMGIIFMFSRSENRKGKYKVIILPVLAVIFSVASCIFNFGWLRLLITATTSLWICIVVFFWSNVFAVPYLYEHRMMKIINLLYNITYIVFWLFLPDFGDMGPAYFFFTLIRHDFWAQIAGAIAVISGALNVLLFIWHTVLIIVLKCRKEKAMLDERKRDYELRQGTLNNEKQ